MHKSMERVRQSVQPEFKSLPMQVKAIDGRSITTLFSVAGNVDSYGDKVWPGAFAATIAQRGTKIFHLFMHDSYSPPIAVVKSLREVGRDELPQEVLSAYPEALGGAEAVSEFLEDARSESIFQAVKAGAPFQASFGYDATKFDFETVGDEQIRNLREVRLWEISTVLWGANDATLGSKGLLSLEMLFKQIEAYQAAFKAGARHSAADKKLLNQIHKAAVDLGATSCKGIVEDEEEETEADKEKSRAGIVPLTSLKAQLDLLELTSISR